MPLPEKALIETLEALRMTTAAVAAVASAQSEVARQALVPAADRRLAEVGRKIEELAEAAAAVPTLFGKNVGDGLDVERSDAREAVALLRTLLLDHTLRSDARDGKVQASFAGSRVLSADEQALVERLTDGHVHEASPAWLEKTMFAADLVRALFQGADEDRALLSVERLEDGSGRISVVPGALPMMLRPEHLQALDRLQEGGSWHL